MGQDVEVVDADRYVGVYHNNRLEWKDDRKAVYRKGINRFYLLSEETHVL